MGVYVLGTQYNSRQSNIPWSQPGGPGTLVFPQQQINVPWGPPNPAEGWPNGYPVPGQFFIESSGLFVAGCGHWQDAPRIFIDQDASFYSPSYLKDPNSQVWQLSATNSGLFQAIPVSGMSAPSSILINDSSISQTWSITIAPLGEELIFTPTAFSTSAPKQITLTPALNGDVFAIQIANGGMEIAYSIIGAGQALALVTCALCTYIQYAMPTAQFYSTMQTPITII